MSTTQLIVVGAAVFVFGVVLVVTGLPFTLVVLSTSLLLLLLLDLCEQITAPAGGGVILK